MGENKRLVYQYNVPFAYVTDQESMLARSYVRVHTCKRQVVDRGVYFLILSACHTVHIGLRPAEVWLFGCFLPILTVKDVSVTRWRRISYVMGTQPVSRAINLGESEMTGGPGLLTVKRPGTVRVSCPSDVSRPRPVFWLLNRTLPDFPQDPRSKIISTSVCKMPTEIGHLI